MRYHELNTVPNKNSKRVGRGISAGQGKTAGRGTKGQKSRAGSSKKPGFEGGQTPLMQRLPKVGGFKSHKVPFETIYTGQLNSLGASVDNHKLVEAGLLENPHTKVKLLLNGEIEKKITVSLQAASKGAVAELKKKGGEFKQVPQIGRSAKQTKQ